MPPRGNQPQERVCAANWRRSLCAAKRDPRLRGCTPLRTPIRKSEGPQATRTQYYCSRLTPVGLPPLLSRELRGCERGATVERSETGERAMFAPAGQTTARAGQLCWLAALVVRRQAPPNPRSGNGMCVGAGLCSAAPSGEGCRPPLPLSSTSRLRQSVGAGHARPSTMPLPPRILCLVGRGLDPSAGRWGRCSLQRQTTGLRITALRPQTKISCPRPLADRIFLYHF